MSGGRPNPGVGEAGVGDALESVQLLGGDKLSSRARPNEYSRAVRGAHPEVKQVKVENSTLWSAVVHAQSLGAPTEPPPRGTANHQRFVSAPFRDELSLLERPKVAEEWSDALLCSTNSRSRRIVRGFA